MKKKTRYLWRYPVFAGLIGLPFGVFTAVGLFLFFAITVIVFEIKE